MQEGEDECEVKVARRWPKLVMELEDPSPPGRPSQRWGSRRRPPQPNPEGIRRAWPTWAWACVEYGSATIPGLGGAGAEGWQGRSRSGGSHEEISPLGSLSPGCIFARNVLNVSTLVIQFVPVATTTP